MITIEYIKPYRSYQKQGKIRLQFAYQYMTIKKDDQVFHFIPIEGKEMIVNPNGRNVENLSEVFVFQRGNRFLRLPLYQLLLVSNMNDFLMPLIDDMIEKNDTAFEDSRESHVAKQDVEAVMREIEKSNINYLIDLALKENNEETFHQLIQQKKSL